MSKFPFPVEILSQILENLQDNSQSLFNCLLTNQTFCHFALGILWRNPIDSASANFHAPIQLSPKSARLIDAYLLCLESEDKAKINSLHSRIKVPSAKPLFNYPQYLRTLNIQKLYDLLCAGLGHKISLGGFRECTMVRSMLVKLFMKNSVRLNHLSIRSNANETGKSSFSEVFAFSAGCSIRNLQTIQYRQLVSPNEEEKNEQAHHVSSLISLQKGLLKFHGIKLSTTQLEILFEGLVFQSETMRELVFERCNFDGFMWLKYEYVFENVDRIRFTDCSSVIEGSVPLKKEIKNFFEHRSIIVS
ncbi:hypothetical protein G9A89_019641 [Geosiphon pyriformis]|nr:hypothetical protein G9A89_019641 [Geosiphon pyriformis]